MERTLSLRVDNEQVRVLVLALKYYKKSMQDLMDRESNSNLTREIFRQEKQLAVDLSKQIKKKDELRKGKLPSLPSNVKQVDKNCHKNFLLEDLYDLKDQNGAVVAVDNKAGLIEVTFKENKYIIKKNQEIVGTAPDERKAMKEFMELMQK
jgi:hypothetical protein